MEAQNLLCLVMALQIQGVVTMSVQRPSDQRWARFFHQLFRPSDVDKDDTGLSEKCLDCICEAGGCKKEIGKCHMKEQSLVCGPFQIREAYWQDCGRPGRSWQECTKELDCSKTCVRNYLRRYAEYCTEGRVPVCKDYALIHHGGPLGCRGEPPVPFWNMVFICMLVI